uniref:Uncharacterized protein n=1 Tax=Physcomitrium patens TaxID=3218 RepID=A0A7I4AH13_PHYPA
MTNYYQRFIRKISDIANLLIIFITLDVDLDVLDALTECLYNQAELFKQAMDMAIEKLSITQYCGTLRYACIYSSAY